jgi:hypothetical protein
LGARSTVAVLLAALMRSTTVHAEAATARPGALPGGAVADVTVVDGNTAWIGASEVRGDARLPRGLLRYDRASGRLHAFRGTDSGPCGFDVLALELRDGTLWVTTELGVSRFRVSEEWDEWAHFARAGDGSLEETACSTLLAPAAEAALAPGGEAVRARLAEFRPRFWRRYQKRRH